MPRLAIAALILTFVWGSGTSSLFDDDGCFSPYSCSSVPIEEHSSIKNALECWHLCRKNNDCFYSTFMSESEKCQLLADCDEISENCEDCVTSRVTCTPSEGYKMVIIGGQYSRNSVIIYDPLGKDEPCILPELPRVMVAMPHGRLLDGNLTLCGGYTDRCYSLVPKSNDLGWEWLETFQVENVEYSPATVSYDGQTWSILNKYSWDEYNHFYVLHEGASEFKLYEKLNGGIYRSCAVQINRTHTIIVSSPDEFKWSDLSHSCGLSYDKNEGYKFVLAGGYVYENRTYEDITATLDLETLTWSEGQKLPKKRTDAASLQYKDSFMLIAGRDYVTVYDDVIEFDQTEGWIEIPRKIHQNYLHGAMYMYEDEANMFCK